MKILMVGGTGIISTAVSNLLVDQGHELYLLNRGLHTHFAPKGAKILIGDINDEGHIKDLIKDDFFDVIANWIIGLPEQIERDIRLFSNKTSQYIFISSASAYQHPTKHYIITEETPLKNLYWEYSRKKIECENRIMKEYKENGFPVTIVRPSLTFGETVIPYVLTSWKDPWSIIHRMKVEKRIIVPGDGTSLWTITFNTDFAAGFIGLLGNKKTIGEAFHITSDEVLTWNDVVEQMADVVGVKSNPVHISSEFIVKFMPDQIGNLFGDKMTSSVFDNSKLKAFVPDFKAKVTFKEGFAKSYAYLKSHPELQTVDEKYEVHLDKVIRAFDYGMSYEN